MIACCGLAALLPARPVRAQRLVGHVVDDATQRPIEGVEIVIFNDDGQDVRSTVSDELGWFLLSVAAPGEYTIRASHIAYREFSSDTIGLGRGETVEIRVRMGATVIPLDPLEVTTRSESIGRLAEFHRRLERHAFGSFIAREDIEATPAPSVSELLRRKPGVRIAMARKGPFERPLIAMRGGPGNCLPNLYIDGVPVRQSLDFPIDDLLTPDMLEGVEVYSTSASVPAQYQTGTQCGVVLFWTRQGEPGLPFSWKRLLIGGLAAGAVVLLLLR